jgi:hypothetical protein
MSYSYQTDIETGRYYTPYGVYQEAEALLEALRKLRTSEITVCHLALVLLPPLTNSYAGD